MLRALINWMDRDWASRRYNPVFAFAQRLVWGVPVFLSLAAVAALESLGSSHDDPLVLGVLALGGAGMFAIMLVSLYRWAAGYSRSDYQERAAAEHRERVSARQAFFRRWWNPDGS
ncbi:hypothetical protein GGQ80_003209 [Sphingomonas jinjuensis]|uniref:Uncharacterized protein n=1 Tax=Sphingomonas jinjuensis TaxID=535907 RepID=A0A840FCD0_9SPHN|nr:hypothetical protein [Sphingomonas jinjuensis]MBB4155289.1 hypothetical protein [Sphingomonas jinjuensis]